MNTLKLVAAEQAFLYKEPTMIENEKSYWIDGDESIFYRFGTPISTIQQFYLNGVRFRLIDQNDIKTAYMTFKYRTPERDLIEIEKEITLQEWDLTLSCADKILEKIRTTVKIEDEHWDIDLYNNHIDGYAINIIRAECEMPYGRDYPLTFDKFINTYRLTLIPTDISNYDILNISSPFIKEYNIIKKIDK
jgi:CYTH domain-containing protein